MEVIPAGQRRIVVCADGSVYRPGFECGPTELVYARPGMDVIVLKEAGHKFWSGRGETSYAPAEYQVYRVLSEIPNPDEEKGRRAYPVGARVYLTERVVEFPVKAERETLQRPRVGPRSRD